MVSRCYAQMSGRIRLSFLPLGLSILQLSFAQDKPVASGDNPLIAPPVCSFYSGTEVPWAGAQPYGRTMSTFAPNN